MFKKILITTVIIFTLFSCSIDNDNSNFKIETLPIKEAIVPSEFILGEIYTLKVTYDLPNECYSFYDLFYKRVGTSREVAINATLDLNLNCTQTVIEKEYIFTVNALQREDYIFKFWKGKDNNGNDIFEEVIVPVVIQ